MKKEYNAGPATGLLQMQQMQQEQQGHPQAPQQGQPQQGKQLSPELQQKAEKWIFNAVKLIHSPQSRARLVEAMRETEGPPQTKVAKVANEVFKRMISSADEKGEAPSEIVMGIAGITIVGELIELGHAEGVFNMTEDEQKASLILALQIYFHDGIKGGEIDPIELQKDLEPLMSDGMRQAGTQVAKQAGLQGA